MRIPKRIIQKGYGIGWSSTGGGTAFLKAFLIASALSLAVFPEPAKAYPCQAEYEACLNACKSLACQDQCADTYLFNCPQEPSCTPKTACAPQSCEYGGDLEKCTITEADCSTSTYTRGSCNPPPEKPQCTPETACAPGLCLYGGDLEECTVTEADCSTSTYTSGACNPAPERFDYEVVVFPGSNTVLQGQEVSYWVTVELTGGTPQQVTLEVPLDSRLNAFFTDGGGLPTFGSLLTIKTTCDTPATLYSPQVIGKSAEYRFTKFDIVSLWVDPNQECNKTVGSAAKKGKEWETGDDGFVSEPLGRSGRVIIGPKSRVRSGCEVFLRGCELGMSGFSVIKGKMHLQYRAEPAPPSGGPAVPSPFIGEEVDGLPIGGIGMHWGADQEYTAVLKGTSVFVEVAEDGTGTLTVLKGAAKAWKTQEPDRTVLLTANQQLTTLTGQPLQQPVPIDPAFSADTAFPPTRPGNWWMLPPKSAQQLPGGILLLVLLVLLGAAAWLSRRGRYVKLLKRASGVARIIRAGMPKKPRKRR